MRTVSRLPALPWLGLVLLGGWIHGCETADSGDNFIAPEIQLDADFFYCHIQPVVIAANSCATGGTPGGGCHWRARTMMLLPQGETDLRPTCDGDRVTGTVPDSTMRNFEAVQLFVRSDALSSPFYRYPTGLEEGHPVLFTESETEATLIEEWIEAGGM